MESGQKKKAVILNVDMLKLEVHVSLCHNLVNRKAKKVSLLMTSISLVLKAVYTPSTSPFVRGFYCKCLQIG